MTQDDDERGGSISPLLSTLSEDERARLAKRGQRRRFASGEVIFLRGDPGDVLYVIEAGRVEISVTSLSGRRSVLNHMGPGEVFGEIAMFDGQDRSTDARAAGDVTLLALHRAEVRGFLMDHPDATMALIADLCRKVRNASDMFEVQAEVDARKRLARCLLRIAEKWGASDGDGPMRIDLGLSQSDIGEFSGLARENVNRNLKALAADGVLRLDGKVIEIPDLETLAEVAEI
ncbi:Crp/Fnr family transcriptional regulator [Tropicimonas marinistellae]|uniref:Crp/Fnr family transcriptional regulator n=1 Tax=Tropicimonas marinistellae TaxID=1739787 RepID=UPI00082D8643|nr:Crp/Fnr family transcriptional regulator [Tropicimonas marinistellae]